MATVDSARASALYAQFDELIEVAAIEAGLEVFEQLFDLEALGYTAEMRDLRQRCAAVRVRVLAKISGYLDAPPGDTVH